MLIKNKEENSLVELKPTGGLISLKDTNKVVLTLIGFSGAILLSLLAILILLVNNSRLAADEKVFVQTVDGKIVQAIEKDIYFRSDKIIQDFVAKWLYLTYELDSSILNSDKNDTGVKLKVGQQDFKIPTAAYTASYGLVDGFRIEFLKKYAAEFVPLEYWRGNFTSTLKIYHISEPIRKDERTYHVNVMATRIDRSSNSEIGKAKFNKTIVLTAINPYQPNEAGKHPNFLRTYLKEQLLNSGLLVDTIGNLKS